MLPRPGSRSKKFTARKDRRWLTLTLGWADCGMLGYPAAPDPNQAPGFKNGRPVAVCFAGKDDLQALMVGAG